MPDTLVATALLSWRIAPNSASRRDGGGALKARDVDTMKVLVLGGAGFIGPRVMHRLVDRGHEVSCMDINPNSPLLTDLHGKISLSRGDITLMDDVVEAIVQAKPDRVLNLAYALGAPESDPHP